ncbi:MAG: transcription-repair coupling factor [Bacteroidota bacterium]
MQTLSEDEIRIDVVKKRIVGSAPIEDLSNRSRELRRGQRLDCKGVRGSLMAFLAAAVFEKRGSQLLLIVPEDDTAEKLRDDCALLLGENAVRWLGHGTSHKAKLLDMTGPLAQIETLTALASREIVLVISSAAALSVPVPSPQELNSGTMVLSVNADHPFTRLLEELLELGFEKKDFVEEYGDFAVRGGIVDIFPFVGDNPIRIEFWGDSIQSLREFDVLSQRSIRTLESAKIIAGFSKNLSESEGPPARFPVPSSSLLQYLEENTLILVDEPSLIEQGIAELRKEGIAQFHGWETLKRQLAEFPQVVHSTIAHPRESEPIDFSSLPQPPIQGSMKFLVHHIKDLTRRGLDVFIACDTKEEILRIKELLEEESAIPEEAEENQPDFATARGLRYTVLADTLHSGFIYEPGSLALFTEHEVFGRLKRRGSPKKSRFKGFTQKELLQLRRGDFVVHADYGIGAFAGLQKIRVRGVEQEVMKIRYDAGDAIYVNLNYINRVQKYASREGHIPTVTKLGSPEWERLKSRARRKIKDMARDLIKLYARRKREGGYSFAADTHWQKEMEASFMYEDTPDQSSATRDVKKDMETPSPMDRLICGDVGFGKTEVAVRAAFKAVMNGKQAAILVPTTILAQQHFHTFVDRLGRYPVRVESISRFKSTKDQKQILENLKSGQLDVLIGTHRLLSKDVTFKDLGLLVIDEEHRFGVAAKEKLRQLRATVDTLTLTATPIPRTLQFSMMGARDLSIINTPPRNRLPIVTEIVEYNIALIREAILKELHRGGQVYFIHDRIQNMEEIRMLLEERIPEARFRSAHGQMKGHELEKTMMDFLEKKNDVLLCTKIIESGIDIPSVNTILINRADRFGLAELYQLRGRVGRSNIQAYAYLLTPPLSSLPKQTLRRLQAIQEFTELGSGFNLAMRDLEIRGAGNLLGGEQSGFIMEMGFELYQRIVEEAVQELKEAEFSELFKDETKTLKGRQADEAIIETDIEALIPDAYIESDAERLDIYRRLARTMNPVDIHALRAELRDRFGEYPPEVEHLFVLVELKALASNLSIARLELDGQRLSLFLPPSDRKSFYESETGEPLFQVLMARVSTMGEYHPHLKQEGKQLKLNMRIPASSGPAIRLNAIRKVLDELSGQNLAGKRASGKLSENPLDRGN